jgi:SMC interacting uncharacterized protein involved in chromosome segregation
LGLPIKEVIVGSKITNAIKAIHSKGIILNSMASRKKDCTKERQQPLNGLEKRSKTH